jgi:hypothetical protein
MTQRAELFARGVERTTLWCERNGIEPPGLRVVPREEWRFAPTCAYYRPTTTNICLKVCAMPGFEPVSATWEIELAGAPERTIAQARKKFVAPVLI